MSATGDVLRIVNTARAEHGRHALAGDITLARAAVRRAAALARAGQLDEHQGWLAALKAVAFRRLGREIGENIAEGQRDAEEVVAAWMASAGHRANILHPGYRRIGIGMAEGHGARYWAQEFSSR